MKKGPAGQEFLEITFNEKTRKNQGDSMSASANALHNDHHVITEIKNSSLCPVASFKMYMDLLNPDSTAFFQYPNKKKTEFTKVVVGKNTLGNMMKEISKKANLSKIYTNHQIRKTTATGMHKEGFSFEQIANVTKHKNLDSLKHYISGPTLNEKQSYNEGLFNYGNPEQNQNRSQKRPQTEHFEANKKPNYAQGKENLQQEVTEANKIALNPKENKMVPLTANDTRTDMKSIVTNQLRQAPNLFQNATFSNCYFNFTLPR